MKNQTKTADDNREVDLLKQAVRLFLDLYEGAALPGEAYWDAMTLGRAALGEGQQDIEQCATNIANALNSGVITRGDAMTTERQVQAVIWETLMRDPLADELQEIAKVFNTLYRHLSFPLLTSHRPADKV